jgi:hypothetical protein
MGPTDGTIVLPLDWLLVGAVIFGVLYLVAKGIKRFLDPLGRNFRVSHDPYQHRRRRDMVSNRTGAEILAEIERQQESNKKA